MEVSLSVDLKSELQIEEEMIADGVKRFKERNQKLLQKGHLSMTNSGLTVTAGGIPRVATKIDEWCQDQWAKAKRGGKNLTLATLTEMESEVAAMIALRETLNSIGVTTQPYTRVAVRIGRIIEAELRYRALAEKTPALHEWAVKKAQKSTSPRHARNVMSWTATKAGVEWDRWTDDACLRVGAVLLTCVQAGTGIIEIGPRNTSSIRVDRTLYVNPTRGILAWIKANDVEAQYLYPVLLPTIIAPRDWTTPFDGGYHSPSIRRDLPLVKTHNKNYLADLEVTEPTCVYAAVNAIQRTPWRVNTRILEVIETMWNGVDPLAWLPSSEEAPLPSKPLDIDTNEEARKVYRTQAAAVWDRNISQRGVRIQAIQIKNTAKRFSKYKHIYFPHQLDFRGRVYPIPGGLQPQGNDLAKALLHFAEGKRLDDREAVEWFFIHGSNTFGVDKVSFDERVKWVEEHHTRIISTANDPAGDRWWTEADGGDNAFQFLAWCFEYAAWSANPDTFESHIPVAVDASCSGLQHFSAMLRDRVGATYTNLVPSEKPQDIYAQVAFKVTERLTADLDPTKTEKGSGPSEEEPPLTVGQVARMWLDFGINRKLCKRPVMTMPYGSTRFACRKFIMDAVGSAGAEVFGDNLMAACGYLTKHVWASIGDVVVAARAAMEWLQGAAKVAANDNRPICWTSPAGFPIRQAYPELSHRRVKLSMGDTLMKITLTDPTDELDKNRQQSGISPNFVHSCDAAALMLAVNRAAEHNIANFAMVHDSFGTHASDMASFSRFIRETFVEMYESTDVLAEFKRDVEVGGIQLDPLPERGTFEIRDMLRSDYCFA